MSNTGLFTSYELGYTKEGETVEVAEVRAMQQREGLLELIHHEGADVPALGGGGHIGITVPSVADALERLTAFGAAIVKPLGTATDPALPDGHTPFPAGFAKVLAKIAFVRDPDDRHWIEFVPQSIHS